MAEICPNCANPITENFCGNCGQKKYKRIDRKYIWDELQYTVFHTSKGLLYSVKRILKNPGKTAKEFINGNRVNHYKPILLAFVLSGISAFISFKIIGLKEIIRVYYSNQKMSSEFMNDLLSFVSSYNSIVMLLFIPFFALATKLAFRRWGQNYYEHVVMNAYILSFYTLVYMVIFYPIMYLFRSRNDIILQLTNLSMLMMPFILTWFFKEFYKEKSLKSIVGRVLLIILLTLAGYIILMILFFICIFIYVTINGPEALEYIKPK